MILPHRHYWGTVNRLHRMPFSRRFKSKELYSATLLATVRLNRQYLVVCVSYAPR